MSDKSSREQLAAAAERAKLEAELALARAEAAQLRLALSEQDTPSAVPPPPPAPPEPVEELPAKQVKAPATVVPPPPPTVESSKPPPPIGQQPAVRNGAGHASRAKPSTPAAPARETPPPAEKRPATVARSSTTAPDIKPMHRNGSPPAPMRTAEARPAERKQTEQKHSQQAPPREKRPEQKQSEQEPPQQKLPKQNPSRQQQPDIAPPISKPPVKPAADFAAPSAPPKVGPPPPVDEEPDDEAPRGWFSRNIFQACGAWSTSLIVHLACLIALGAWMLPAILEPDPPMLEALQIREDEELTRELEENLTPATEMTMNVSSSVMQTGHQSAMTGAMSDPAYDKTVEESIDAPKVAMGDVSIWSVGQKDFGMEVPDGAPGEPHAIVDNYDQAFDRITQEILMMLYKSKVMVVWLFDQSESMKDDQKEIRDRIEKVYQELGLADAAQGDALVTAVASYGSGWRMHTSKPTYNIDVIRRAIDEVPIDPSGKEMMCDAIGATCTALHSAATSGRRQLAMIVVTDESGDQKSNVAKLEAALAAARAARCRLYFLGREAVFGYPFAHMRWHHPRVGTRWLPIDRGPETPEVEQLQTEGFRRRYDAHPSGFGPYEEARLARETGGIFFMLPSLETKLVRGDNRKYELEAMRPYMPDLSARAEYIFERQQIPMRSALWTVIHMLNPYDAEKAKVIDLRFDFSPNPNTFVKQANAEQAKAKLYVTFLDEAEKVLEGLREQRDRELYPRWKANYDLIFAQVLAYKVHVYEYGAYLEEFKRNPKVVPLKKPPNHTLSGWHIRHRQETVTGELTAEYIARARAMFEKIIQEHAGTPWAARAEWELKRGFGVELYESYSSPSPRPRPRPSGPPVVIPKL